MLKVDTSSSATTTLTFSLSLSLLGSCFLLIVIMSLVVIVPLGAGTSYDLPQAIAEKNRAADATNPNLASSNNFYHSIEDLSGKEHLYDEINQQKGNNIQGQFSDLP